MRPPPPAFNYNLISSFLAVFLKIPIRLLTVVALALLAGLPAGTPAFAQWAGVPLDSLPRIYGLTVARSEPPLLYLSTPGGLYAADPEALARPVSAPEGNLMALAHHPLKPNIMYLGGHTPKEGDLGVLRSTDGGKQWKRISQGLSAHTGFHLLEISKANPEVMYGVTTLLHRSMDGGRTWKQLGPLPQQLIGLAASARQVDTLYAATQKGLLLSRDTGRTWNMAHPSRRTASMVFVSPKGRVYAFVIGAGLIARDEGKTEWEPLSRNFQDRILFRMAIDPASGKRIYATTWTGGVMTSPDGGRSWSAFEGSHQARPAIIAKGRKLFGTFCQACHGPDGRGQDPASIPPGTPNPILAPALNDSAHAWHHSDTNLVETILNGSPREGSPMIAWKGQLSRSDAESLVAYVKSLWSFRSLACQGARHMACMRRQ